MVVKKSVNRRLMRSKVLLKEYKVVAGIVGVIVVLALLAFVAVSFSRSASPFEITGNDLFASGNFSGKSVELFGVRLGATMPQVLAGLGKADNEKTYDPGIVTWEYGKSLDLDGTGLILQFQSGVLVRMTFKESFNKLLVGQTKIVHSKDEMYSLFGAPSGVRHVQSNAATGRAFQIVTYADKNFEFILLGDKENGFSFYL
ncbi:MAG: hypothetical protein Q7R56_01955 [Nanoarchaeota archaeon]|nr:hypothetical protein [Nanoarchaeota archaeon]